MCCSSVRPGPERNCSLEPSTEPDRDPTADSSPSTAGRDPLNCSKANCSAADPLNPSPESSGKPDRAPSTSTKSPSCHSRLRLDSSEQSSTTKSCPSAGRILKPLKHASSPRPAGTSPEKSMAAAFRKTCSIGSMESNCRFLRFEIDSKMSPNWSSSLSRNTPRRWGNE